MWPPIQNAVQSSAAARAVLGTKPIRFYEFGSVPEVSGAAVKPYATWQVINGSPENYLNRLPDMDGMTLQVDVFGTDRNETTRAAVAIRDAIEAHAHITFWRSMGQDKQTKLFRFTFTIDWFNPRT